MGGTTFENSIGLSAHVFNPQRGLHGLVRETLSPAGRGCASNPKAGPGNLGEEHVFLFIATSAAGIGASLRVELILPASRRDACLHRAARAAPYRPDGSTGHSRAIG
jgi:hypothetical protein